MKLNKLKLAVMAIALLVAGAAKAQVSFNHSFGANGYYATGGSGWGFLYSPRLNLAELGNDMTFSVGTHLGLGLSGGTNSQTGAEGSFLLDLPLMAELNFGHAANSDSRADWGGFAGLGYGYNTMAYSENTAFGTVSGSSSSSGLVINAGIRTKAIKDISCGLRVSYMINFKTGGSDVFGIGAFYTLGMN